MGEDQIVCAGILRWTRRAILLLILAAGTNGMGQESSIDLTKLSVGQLSGLKHQIGGEEKMLTSSYAQLRQASNQFKESREVMK